MGENETHPQHKLRMQSCQRKQTWKSNGMLYTLVPRVTTTVADKENYKLDLTSRLLIKIMEIGSLETPK